MDYTPLTLSDIRFVIVKKIKWIILFSILFAFLGFLISKTITPTYEASTEVLVNQKHSNSDQAYSNQQADIQIINTYKSLITNPFVIKRAVSELNSGNKQSKWTDESLQKSIKIKTQPNSQAFSITVKSSNAKESAEAANILTNIFKERIHKVMKNNNVTIISKASIPRKPTFPKYKLNIMIGALVGLLGSFIYFIICEQIDGHVIHTKYLEDRFGLREIGELHIK